MFENVEMLPADAILGLTEAFKNDANPDKVNLGAGIYKNADGVTPIFEADKRAEKILQGKLASKTYLPIPGSNEYGKVVQELLFGPGSSIIETGRAITAQTPGGTGALRIAGEVLKKIRPKRNCGSAIRHGQIIPVYSAMPPWRSKSTGIIIPNQRLSILTG